MTNKNKTINFIIDHIDPLGQGVFKQEDRIYFISKVLVNESGTANIYKSKKNIHFATSPTIESKSKLRVTPDCPHYNQCNGCHYLHTKYSNEVALKEQAMKRMAKYDFGDIQINVHKAPRRSRYRNRIQLHYNKYKNQIGFINPKTKSIISVQECQMPTQELFSKFQVFLTNWKENAPNKPQGHVELYIKDGNFTTNWNKRYSEGGFTQVYEEMNNVLNKLVEEKSDPNSFTLDLFGGDGNLSKTIGQKLIIDFYQEESNDLNKINIDLYDINSLNAVEKLVTEDVKTFIIDPPRKGFPLLSNWVKKYNPETIIYVSCHPQTMFRDIRELKESYKLVEVHMLDLFPSTYHFEGLVVLKKH